MSPARVVDLCAEGLCLKHATWVMRAPELGHQAIRLCTGHREHAEAQAKAAKITVTFEPIDAPRSSRPPPRSKGAP